MTYRASDYDHFFTKVAKAIGLMGLEIRRCVDETKGTHIVGLVSVLALSSFLPRISCSLKGSDAKQVNTKGDEIAQLATTLTPHDITFVKMLIKKIVKAPYEAFCVGSKEALDVASKLDPCITASKAEILLDKLVRQGWFHLSR